MEKFLCPVHRKWLMLHPMEAHAHLQQTHQQGLQLRQQHQWRQALEQLGCAYEIAEVLLEMQGRKRDRLTLEFTSIAMMLADCWHKLDDDDSASSLLEQAEKHLQQATTDVHSTYLKQCLDSLKRSAQFFRHMASLAVFKPSLQLH